MNQREVRVAQRLAALEAMVARLTKALEDADIPIPAEEEEQ